MRNLWLILLVLAIYVSCEKEGTTPVYTYNYKLQGIYSRDTANKAEGYKRIHFREDGSYCWTRVISGKDSNFCYGKYQQTSDTSLLWEENTLVTFKVSAVDTVPNGIMLQLNASPPMAPLYNFY